MFVVERISSGIHMILKNCLTIIKICSDGKITEITKFYVSQNFTIWLKKVFFFFLQVFYRNPCANKRLLIALGLL